MNMVLDTKKSSFWNQQWLRFHIWFIMTLYYQIRQTLLQNVTAILLQNSTKVYYKCNSFVTKCDSYYKIQRLLQNGLVQPLTLLTKPNRMKPNLFQRINQLHHKDDSVKSPLHKTNIFRPVFIETLIIILMDFV